MKFAIATALLLLVGCAAPTQPNRTALWRDVSGAGRQESQLGMDMAACDYEITMALQTAPAHGTGRYAGEYAAAMSNIARAAKVPDRTRLEQKCMAARGWQFAGWE